MDEIEESLRLIHLIFNLLNLSTFKIRTKNLRLHPNIMYCKIQKYLLTLNIITLKLFSDCKVLGYYLQNKCVFYFVTLTKEIFF